MAESGLSRFDVNPWFGLLAPARLSTDVVGRINADVNAVLALAETAESFKAQGAEPYRSTPAAFARELESDIAKWGKVVRDSGARVD